MPAIRFSSKADCKRKMCSFFFAMDLFETLRRHIQSLSYQYVKGLNQPQRLKKYHSLKFCDEESSFTSFSFILLQTLFSITSRV